jgi:hypothetical protein
MTTKLKDDVGPEDFGITAAEAEKARNYAAFMVAAERELCQQVCRRMSFEFNAGSREQDALQSAATRLDMPEFRA